MSDPTFTATEQIAAAHTAIALVSEKIGALLEDVNNGIERGEMVSVDNLDALAKYRAIYDVACRLNALIMIRRLPRYAELTDEEVVLNVIERFNEEIDLMVDPSDKLTGAKATIDAATRTAIINVGFFFSFADERTLNF